MAGHPSHLFGMETENWERENKRGTSQLLRFFCSRSGAAGFKTGIVFPQQRGNGDWTRSSLLKHHFLLSLIPSKACYSYIGKQHCLAYFS